MLSRAQEQQEKQESEFGAIEADYVQKKQRSQSSDDVARAEEEKA